MRQKFIIGNWKMHTTSAEAGRLEGHAVIRHRFGRGSVKPENAAGLLSRPGVDGALIGGASLQAEQFLAIVRAGISAV